MSRHAERTNGPRPENHNLVRALAVAALVVLMWLGYRNIGLPPVIIVGGSGVVAFAIWSRSYLKQPTDPMVILPLFLLTIAALELHMAEEYVAGFAPAMSRLFNISWTERSFLLVFAFVGPSIYALTALGLLYRRAFAGFVAWFIFIGPGLAEFTHFIFPLLRPALSPEITAAVTTRVANGRWVADMRNYWIGATHHYYFPGLYTAVLPMIPGIVAIWRLAARRQSLR